MTFNAGSAPSTATSRRTSIARVRTQEGSTAFSDGRAFRLPFEYSVAATPVTIRFTSPVNFNLTLQELSCDQGSVRLDAYRDVTEAGEWTPVEAFRRNLVDNPGYTRQVMLATGGTITPTGPSVDKIRLRTAGTTAQRANVGAGLFSKRRLAAGTYYLRLSRIDGNIPATGIYLIEWEELTE